MSERDPVNIELEKYEALKSLVRKVRELQYLHGGERISINSLPSDWIDEREGMLLLEKLEAELDEAIK